MKLKMLRMIIWHFQLPSVFDGKTSTASKPDIPLLGYQGGAVSKDFGLCTSPAVLGGEVQPSFAQPTTSFGRMYAGIEMGNEAISYLLG